MRGLWPVFVFVVVFAIWKMNFLNEVSLVEPKTPISG